MKIYAVILALIFSIFYLSCTKLDINKIYYTTNNYNTNLFLSNYTITNIETNIEFLISTTNYGSTTVNHYAITDWTILQFYNISNTYISFYQIQMGDIMVGFFRSVDLNVTNYIEITNKIEVHLSNKTNAYK